MPTVRDDCLDAVFDFMLNYDWENEEIFDGFSDPMSHIKYYAIVLPKKSPYIKEACEWICGGKDAYNYESTKESLNHLPNILIYIYIQLDQNEPEPYNTPFIVDAFFDVGVYYTETVGFADEMPQELSQKIIKASKKYFE